MAKRSDRSEAIRIYAAIYATVMTLLTLALGGGYLATGDTKALQLLAAMAVVLLVGPLVLLGVLTLFLRLFGVLNGDLHVPLPSLPRLRARPPPRPHPPRLRAVPR